MNWTSKDCRSQLAYTTWETFRLYCCTHGLIRDMGEDPTITDLQNAWVEHVNEVEGR